MLEPGTVLADRFTVLSKHGQGAMGEVFAAFDEVRQTRVAIKLLGRCDSQALALLKREFRAAVDLVHPNLVRLHELFVHGANWFFSMESIDGVTLPTRMQALHDRDPAYVRHIMGQLADGVRALHQVGTLHGDLKPSNFLITSDDRVVLLDFGLSRSSGRNQPFEVSGTFGYMAPEQERAQILTEAADWYSFGVVLHEALTGRLPCSESPWLIQDAPPDLAELCLRLLQREPSHRPSGDEILATLRVAVRHTSSMPAPHASSQLFGREEELARLRDAYQALQRGERGVVLVHGPSGIGKTTLIQTFLREVEDHGALVLEGRCRERESIGYKAVDSLIEHLVTQLGRLTPELVGRVIPANVADLMVLFPGLRASAVLAAASQAAPEPVEYARVRVRAIQAFASLIAGLARCAPLVVWLDDLQWSDAESAVLLSPALGGVDAAPVLLIASFRSAPEAPGPLLSALYASPQAQLPEPRALELGPLSEQAADHMARSLLPAGDPVAALLAREIVRDASGHPLFIVELSHAATRLDATGDVTPLPPTLVALVRERMDALPSHAREFLEVIAIAGEPLPRQLFRSACALAPGVAEEAVELLRAHRLVRTDGLRERDAIDSHHDRIREIVRQSIPADERRKYHRKLANALETWPESRAARRAQHYEAAGDAPSAARDYLAAAEQALVALAFSHAAELYEKAIGLGALDPVSVRTTQIRRAEALAFAGRGPDAADLFLAQAAACPADQALDLQRRAAEELVLAGHLDRGLALIDALLRTVAMQSTRGGRRALLPYVLGRAWLNLRGYQYTPRTERELSREQRRRLDVAWSTAWSLMFTDPTRAVEFQTRHMRLALAAGEPGRVLRALTLEASATAARGARGQQRTARLLATAAESAALTDDPIAHGLLVLSRGTCEYLQGRLQPALELCQEALAQLGKGRSPAVWERMHAQRFVISLLFWLGRVSELTEFLSPLLAEVEGTRNLTAAAVFRTGYSTSAWLARDQLAEADRQLSLARAVGTQPTFQLTDYSLLIGESLRDLYAGEYARGHARLGDAWPHVKAAGLLRIGVIRVQLNYLRAALGVALAAPQQRAVSAIRAGALLRHARQVVRGLAKECDPRARALGAALHAAVDAAADRRDDAAQHLAACVEEFDAQGMRLFAAAARWRWGTIVGGASGAAARDGARAEFERARVVNPERLVALLAPGFPD